jgi:hypothetical protein
LYGFGAARAPRERLYVRVGGSAMCAAAKSGASRRSRIARSGPGLEDEDEDGLREATSISCAVTGVISQSTL